MRGRRSFFAALLASVAVHGARADATPRFERVDRDGDLATGTMDLPGAGVALGDLDRDGDDDLFIVRPHEGLVVHRIESGALLRADPLPPRPDTVTGAWDAIAVAPADLDGDGVLDLLLGANGAAYLLLGRADGSFVDRTPFAFDGLWRQVASFALADVDGDGLLDVYLVTYIAGASWPHNRCDRDALFLQRNTGWLSVPLPDASDANGAGCGFGAVMFDQDGDGDFDPWVANDFGSLGTPTHIWRNAGIDPASGALRIVPAVDATARPIATYAMGVAVGDLDDDGRLDVVSTSIGRAPVLRGDGAGHFVDITESFGAGSSLGWLGTRVTWGSAIVDLDGDGTNDVLEAGGYLPLAPSLGARPGGSPTLLYSGNGLARIEDAATMRAVLGDAELRGLAIGDIDRDGAPDVAFAGAQRTASALLRNAGRADDRRLSVTPHGSVSPREARGAIVTLACDGVANARRSVVPTGGNAASFSAPRAFVSLTGCRGPSASIETHWPSGAISRERVPLPLTTHSIAIDEPRWLVVDTTELAIGSSTMVAISPALFAADGLSAHDVQLRRVTGDCEIEPMGFGSDGVWHARLTARTEGESWIEIVIDGSVVARRIRIEGHPANRVSDVRFVPSSISPSRPVEIAFVPRGIDGSTFGPGQHITVAVDGGSAATLASDRGDGRYVARVTLAPDRVDPIVVRASLPDGRDLVTDIPVVADLDARRTVLRVNPGYLLPGTTPAYITIDGPLVTPLGDPFPTRYDGSITLVDDTGASIGRTAGGWPTTVAFVATPLEAVGRPLHLRFGALDVSDAVQTQALASENDVAQVLDATRTRLDSLQSTLAADGVDSTVLAFRPVDSHGNGVPVAVTWEIVNGTLVGSAGTDADGSTLTRVIAGTEPGTLTAIARAAGSSWSTTIELVPASDTRASALEMCASGVSLPSGEAWLDIVIAPRRIDRVLVGGQRDLVARANGTSMMLTWDHGSWVGRIAIDRAADFTTLDATDRGTTVPLQPAAALVATLELPTRAFVRNDPSATWFGESRCAVAGVVDESDAGVVARDAGAPLDVAITDGAADASSPLHAGGGCGCGVIGGAGSGAARAAWVVAIAMVMRRRRNTLRGTA